MCLLALCYRVVEDAPVVAGANREEFYRRGGEPPRLLDTSAAGHAARAAAGIDPAAGGTWLGVNEHGVLVAVTNRPKSRPPERPRSRGLLARDLLAFPTARAAAEHAVRELDRDLYAGCNFLCADPSSATVIHAGDWLRVRPLPPGLHVLTNGDVNDPSDDRVGHVLAWLGSRDCRTAVQVLDALREVCAHHPPDNPPICFRLADRGTVSSSLIALRSSLVQSAWWHAQGPPDRTPYADCSHLLRDLAYKPGAPATGLGGQAPQR
jgi:uncharacterized protein with NRDE domain